MGGGRGRPDGEGDMESKNRGGENDGRVCVATLTRSVCVGQDLLPLDVGTEGLSPTVISTGSEYSPGPMEDTARICVCVCVCVCVRVCVCVCECVCVH